MSEEPKLMTLQEIAEKCKIGKHKIISKKRGPVQVINGEFYELHKTNEVFDRMEISCFDFTDDWKIIPPEPVVLSVTEEARKWIKQNTDGYLLEAFKAGDKHGQIKRQRDLQPLIDAVERYINDPHLEWHESNIIEAFNNIKPLDKDE